eukprot:516714-Rhodomonas_salina.2
MPAHDTWPSESLRAAETPLWNSGQEVWSAGSCSTAPDAPGRYYWELRKSARYTRFLLYHWSRQIPPDNEIH